MDLKSVFFSDLCNMRCMFSPLGSCLVFIILPSRVVITRGIRFWSEVWGLRGWWLSELCVVLQSLTGESPESPVFLHRLFTGRRTASAEIYWRSRGKINLKNEKEAKERGRREKQEQNKGGEAWGEQPCSVLQVFSPPSLLLFLPPPPSSLWPWLEECAPSSGGGRWRTSVSVPPTRFWFPSLPLRPLRGAALKPRLFLCVWRRVMSSGVLCF